MYLTLPPLFIFSFSYAFVEYEDSRDATDAYQRLHGKSFHGGFIRIEWAKKGPESRRDRFDAGRRGTNNSNGKDRSRSPRRNENDDDRKRDRSPRDERNNKSVDRSPRVRSVDHSPRNTSRSPRNRSVSPVRSPKMSDHEGPI